MNHASGMIIHDFSPFKVPHLLELGFCSLHSRDSANAKFTSDLLIVSAMDTLKNYFGNMENFKCA